VKVLIVGGGAREHAIAWKVRQSPLVKQLYAAPGNPGIAAIATCVPVDAANVVELADLAEKLRIDLTIVGPELPLTLGIVEELEKRGLSVFGASSRAVTIESSKVFAKEFMARHGIPTAASEVFQSPEAAREYLSRDQARYPIVVKADGLAGGKGVVICADPEQAREAVLQMMEDRIHGNAGDRIIVEEFLEGREASYFAISDGESFVPLVTCQDYKRAFDGDVGPNTGGMGAYSPSAYVDETLSATIAERIVAPTIAGLAAEGRTYKGVLYAGVMLTAEGPRVLEFNARFGDPETQVLMPRAAFDIVPLMASAAAGRLDEAAVAWTRESAATVVLAAAGYPGAHARGMPIEGLAEAEGIEGVVVFQAGTSAGPEGRPVVAGGRVLSVTALGRDVSAAVGRAYEAVARLRFEGMHFRTDIGRDAIRKLEAAPLPPS
jgi:phosphoribosylamine--glycine ligase